MGTAFLGLTVGLPNAIRTSTTPSRNAISIACMPSSTTWRIATSTHRGPASRKRCKRLRRRRRGPRRFLAATAAGQPAWEKRPAALPDIWTLPGQLETVSLRTKGHAILHKPARFVSRRRAAGLDDAYLLSFVSPLKDVSAIRVEALADPERFNRGPGRGSDQKCILTGVTVQSGPANPAVPLVAADLSGVTADYCQPGYDIRGTLTSSDTTGWALDQMACRTRRYSCCANRCHLEPSGRLVIRLLQRAGDSHQMLRFRVMLSAATASAALQQAVPEEIRRLAATPAERHSADDRATLKRYYESASGLGSPELAAWNAALTAYAQAAGATAAHTVRDRNPTRETFVHLRGDYRRPGEQVTPGFLTAIPCSLPANTSPGKAGSSLTRLDLARWIVDPKNPLTARVAANDFWQHLFGFGLVSHARRLRQAGRPAFACGIARLAGHEFVANHWSRKALIREIVCSAAYRRARWSEANCGSAIHGTRSWHGRIARGSTPRRCATNCWP